MVTMIIQCILGCHDKLHNSCLCLLSLLYYGSLVRAFLEDSYGLREVVFMLYGFLGSAAEK